MPARRWLRSPPTGPRSRAIPLTPKLGVAMPPTRLTGKLEPGSRSVSRQVDLGHAGLETVVEVVGGDRHARRRQRRRPGAHDLFGPGQVDRGGVRERGRNWRRRWPQRRREGVGVDVLGGGPGLAPAVSAKAKELAAERRGIAARPGRAVGGDKSSMSAWPVYVRSTQMTPVVKSTRLPSRSVATKENGTSAPPLRTQSTSSVYVVPAHRPVCRHRWRGRNRSAGWLTVFTSRRRGGLPRPAYGSWTSPVYVIKRFGDDDVLLLSPGRRRRRLQGRPGTHGR